MKSFSLLEGKPYRNVVAGGAVTLVVGLLGAVPMHEAARPSVTSLTDLRGVGAEIWAGMDAAEYLRDLRDEWDR